MLKVVTRSTAHLDEFLTELKRVPGVARTRTTIVLSTPFERGGLPVEALAVTHALDDAQLAVPRSAAGAGSDRTASSNRRARCRKPPGSSTTRRARTRTRSCARSRR